MLVSWAVQLPEKLKRLLICSSHFQVPMSRTIAFFLDMSFRLSTFLCFLAPRDCVLSISLYLIVGALELPGFSRESIPFKKSLFSLTQQKGTTPLSRPSLWITLGLFNNESDGHNPDCQKSFNYLLKRLLSFISYWLTVRNNCFFQSYNSPNFWTLFIALHSHLQTSQSCSSSFFFFHLVKWSQQQLKYNLFSSLVPRAINALGTLLAFQVIAGKFYQMLFCIASSQPLISVSLLPDPWPMQHLRGSVRVPYCLYQLWF